MPADFDKCVKDGGKVRTVKGPNKEHGLKEGETVAYCIIEKDGKEKSFRGEIKKSGGEDKGSKKEESENVTRFRSNLQALLEKL